MKNTTSLLLILWFFSFLSCDDQFFESNTNKNEKKIFEKYEKLARNTSIERSGRLRYVDSMVDFTRDLPRDTLLSRYLLDISISYGKLGFQDSSYIYKHRALKLSSSINGKII